MNDFDINYADFRRIDLNLLVAFDALMQEGHVGRAAERVFLGQPAMSHALARLRETLGDPLFIRAGNRMEATALALELAPRVRAWLQQADGFLFARPAFNPATAQGTCRIAVPDGLEALLFPPLTAHLCREAPGVRLRAQLAEFEHILPALDADEIDLAVSHIDQPLREWHNHLPLLESHFDYVYSERQLALPNPVGAAELAGFEHVVSSHRGAANSVVDRFFAARGLTRRVRTVSASLIATGHIVAAAPLVSIQPRIYSPLYRGLADVTVRPLDEPMLKIDIGLIWHRRNDDHPLLGYLRGLIGRLLAH
jgi:DNA-binding transcriptional LysR family regulator